MHFELLVLFAFFERNEEAVDGAAGVLEYDVSATHVYLLLLPKLSSRVALTVKS
jgi:hypothetical protein